MSNDKKDMNIWSTLWNFSTGKKCVGMKKMRAGEGVNWILG